jgi:hypothetical protein
MARRFGNDGEAWEWAYTVKHIPETSAMLSLQLSITGFGNPSQGCASQIFDISCKVDWGYIKMYLHTIKKNPVHTMRQFSFSAQKEKT